MSLFQRAVDKFVPSDRRLRRLLALYQFGAGAAGLWSLFLIGSADGVFDGRIITMDEQVSVLCKLQLCVMNA